MVTPARSAAAATTGRHLLAETEPWPAGQQRQYYAFREYPGSASAAAREFGAEKARLGVKFAPRILTAEEREAAIPTRGEGGGEDEPREAREEGVARDGREGRRGRAGDHHLEAPARNLSREVAPRARPPRLERFDDAVLGRLWRVTQSPRGNGVKRRVSTRRASRDTLESSRRRVVERGEERSA